MTLALEAEALGNLLEVLRIDGHDFRDYRHEVLGRRVAEYLRAAGVADHAAYLARLAGDRGERARLISALLVSTSAFFRNPAQFAALQGGVLARLVPCAPRQPVRAWVAGAATGEEVWSLAMVLAEHEARGGASWELIASDANPDALAIARAARYRADDTTAIPAALRMRYLQPDGDTAVVVPALRDRVTFSRHDLLGPSLAPAEAVLARFELVLCQNVLIYLDARLQDRLLDRLVTVLAPGGVLGLGPYEAPTPSTDARLEAYPGLPRDAHLHVRRSHA